MMNSISNSISITDSTSNWNSMCVWIHAPKVLLHGFVWKVSFDFHSKIEMKIEKIVNFGLCTNIEFWILTPTPNDAHKRFDWKTKFEIIDFWFSLFILKRFFTHVEKRYLIFVFKKKLYTGFLMIFQNIKY